MSVSSRSTPLLGVAVPEASPSLNASNQPTAAVGTERRAGATTGNGTLRNVDDHQAFCFPKPPYECFTIAPDFEHPPPPPPPPPPRNVTIAAAADAVVVVTTNTLLEPAAQDVLSNEEQQLRLYWNELWNKIYEVGPRNQRATGHSTTTATRRNGECVCDIWAFLENVFPFLVWFYIITMWFGGQAWLESSPVFFVVYIGLGALLLGRWAIQQIYHVGYQNRRTRALQALFSDQNEAILGLHQLGYTVEYQQEGHVVGKNTEYVYLYRRPTPTATTAAVNDNENNDYTPMSMLTRFVQRHGYLRVEFFHTADAFRLCGDKPLQHVCLLQSSLPNLVEFDSLNAPKASVNNNGDNDESNKSTHATVWTAFWSRHAAAMHQRIVLYRTLAWAMALSVVLAVVAIVGAAMDSDDVAFVGYIGMIVAVMAAGVVFLYIFNPCPTARDEMLLDPLEPLPQSHLQYALAIAATEQDHPDELARRGFYWETRNTVRGPIAWWMPLLQMSGHHVHYFYLFPPDNTAAHSPSVENAAMTSDDLC